VDGYLEGLEDGVFEPTPAVLATMREETRRLERLAGDLGALSRAEAGAFDLAVEPADLGRIAAGAADALAVTFDEKGIALRTGPFPELPVDADPVRMAQVFTNIIRNAWEHTPPGGTVTVSAHRAGTDAVVAIADDGAGIAPEHLPHVFERFYRIDPEQRAGGTGIGLTIARSITRAHGGDVSASSPGPGHGASFEVRIPAA
jgi:signal transduction histidine kinase